MQNEPAFPTPHQIIDANHEHFKFGSHGMSLRDYFAAKAMQAIIAKFPPVVETTKEGDDDDAKQTSIGAYIYADAMLEARQNRGAK